MAPIRRVRHAIGIGFAGYTFDDRFLIADVRAALPFSNERHFHFDPPWNPGRQVLIHPQPDGVWRIDWQVPPETDADVERSSGGLDRRIRAVIGAETPYELVWMTGYRFSQRLADAFRSGRVFLAGDAAHVMSPFGARGLNSGVADAENLAWKLAWVLARRGAAIAARHVRGRAAPGGAVENLDATDATMRFMAPHGPLRRTWRDLVLRMAPRLGLVPAAGELRPPRRAGHVRDFEEAGTVRIVLRLGSVAPDVPLLGGGRLRDRLGRGFVAVVPRAVGAGGRVDVVVVGPATVVRNRIGPGSSRPDGHISGQYSASEATPEAFERARRRAPGPNRRDSRERDRHCTGWRPGGLSSRGAGTRRLDGGFGRASVTVV